MRWHFVTHEPEYSPDWILGFTLAEWLYQQGYPVSAKGYGARFARTRLWGGSGSGPEVLAGLRGRSRYVLTSGDPSQHRFQSSIEQIVTTHPLVQVDQLVIPASHLAYPVPEEFFETDSMAAVFQVTREFRLEHRPRVVFGGNYGDGAGLSILFQVARTLLRGQGELILLNGYPHRDQLAPVVKSLGLEEVVIFLPRLGHREESAIFHSADLYVDPTHRPDSFPVGALRAMASNLPVVTWETPLMTALANRGALMVAPNRDDAWAPAIREALDNEPLRERMIERTLSAMAAHRVPVVGQAFLQIASQWRIHLPPKV